MFRVLFLEIYQLSIIRNPHYLKAEIYILNYKKFNKKVKFQWKFLIVKRKIFENFDPNIEKSDFLVLYSNSFKKILVSWGSAPQDPRF